MPSREEFLAVFKTETEDHLTKLDNGIVELERHSDDSALVKELNREAHTLKGSARVFGYQHIQDIAHKVEDIFDRVSRGKLAFESSVAEAIFQGLDAVRTILGKIVEGEETDVDVSGVCGKLEECLVAGNRRKAQSAGRRAKGKKQKAKLKTAKKEKAEKAATGNQQQEMRKKKKTQKEKKPKTRKTASSSNTSRLKRESKLKEKPKKKLAEPEKSVEEYIRVPVSRVNKLLNLTGEIIINKMKSSYKIAEAKKLSKLSKQTQKEFSSLSEEIDKELASKNQELFKLISQCNAEIRKLRESSASLYDNISAEAFHLDPVIDELQAKIKEMRMLPCSTIFEGFPRMVRDIASQQGKKVDIEISGEQTELDKKVLERTKTPLIHILRNCVDHGIEKPRRREALGKPRYGTIKLSAFHKAGNVVIEVEDDGKGIKLDEVKQTVLKKQLVSRRKLEQMAKREALNMVFANGYSTSLMITDVSGRGIGLDVVRRDIENLKGQVVLDTELDKGTKFTLTLPLTIAIVQVLLVKAQGMLFAFPMHSVRESLKISAEEISTLEGRMAIELRGHSMPVVRLSDVLKLPATQVDTDKDAKTHRLENGEASVVVVTSLERQVGFIVDEIVSEQEIFMKSLGEHLGKVKNVSGATILGTGEVIVILDVADLLAEGALSHPAADGRKLVLRDGKRAKRILVVEDALSTRELEKSILEAQGYEVDTAVDGLDALEKMSGCQYDLIVSDIKMPRMDGFEFCKTIKQNDDYKEVPIVIVTSLEKGEDKRRGIEVGASAYIVKKSFDQSSLLDTIERLIG